MKQFDHSLPTPEENLACDEALLEWCEERPGLEVLRFWESSQWFVVLGYGNRHLRETYASACQRDGVPVLRRCSGGGTVLQGPGCLNYSLILSIADNPGLATITEANRSIMDRNAAALTKLLSETVTVRGFTDLTRGDLKFSGNAQRRRRHCLLFHGTFLLRFDSGKIATYLRMPEHQPAYRKERDHATFVTTLGVSPAGVKQALEDAWQAREPLQNWPQAETARLVREKYSLPDWNLKR